MAEVTVTNPNAPRSPVYLSTMDMVLRYSWVALCLTFSYPIDALRLQDALKELLLSYSSLAGRIRPDSSGRFYMDKGCGVPLTTTSKPEISLADVPSLFMQQHVPDASPNNTLMPELIEQLQPHKVLAGEEAPLQLRLTHLRDGCALGVSISHLLADGESLGQMLADLSTLYKKQQVPLRQESRLGMQQYIGQAAGLLAEGASHSDEDIVATLTALEDPPASFEECVKLGFFIWRALTAEERQAGTSRSSHLLHLPEHCLKRLRKEILSSSIAKQASVDYVSQTDIAVAVLWMLRETANGSQLEAGLQHPISNIIGLRSNGFTQLNPVPYFGNALSFSLIPPPSEKNGGQKLIDVLAAAACAVRQGTQAFRADADASAKKLHAGLPMLVKAEVLNSPEANYFKGCSADVVSWRNMYNKVDFGQGPPVLTLGEALPTLVNVSFVMDGPSTDGLLCSIWLLENHFRTLQESQVLSCIAHEASFLQKSAK